MDMGFFATKKLSFKRKFRWAFEVDPYIGMNLSADMLPPMKSARPSITFKEQTIEHLFETVYIPGKPDWGTIEVSLFDIHCGKNPIFEWLKKIYDPKEGEYNYLVGERISSSYKIPIGFIKCLDACGGNVLECWAYEGMWPQKIEWGDLDMGSSDILTVDMTMRYDRAYQLLECEVD